MKNYMKGFEGSSCGHQPSPLHLVLTSYASDQDPGVKVAKSAYKQNAVTFYCSSSLPLNVCLNTGADFAA